MNTCDFPECKRDMDYECECGIVLCGIHIVRHYSIIQKKVLPLCVSCYKKTLDSESLLIDEEMEINVFE